MERRVDEKIAAAAWALGTALTSAASNASSIALRDSSDSARKYLSARRQASPTTFCAK
jgi:hypothetical protein